MPFRLDYNAQKEERWNVEVILSTRIRRRLECAKTSMALLFSRRMALNRQFHWSRVVSALKNITDSRNDGEAPSPVLNALRSTVGPTEHPMRLGLSRSDPLAPRSRKQADEFKLAMEAGKKAAEYVVSRWPRLMRDIGPKEATTRRRKFKGANEETLRYMIETRKTGRALKMLRKLRANGVEVSLDAQNEMLDLLAYYGLGNPRPTSKNAIEKEAEIESESPDDFDDPSRSSSKSRRDWNVDNHAEKFFAAMTERDAGSYEAMIGGTVRYGNAERAFAFYDEMRSKGMQPGILTYNSLLACVGDVKSNPIERWNAAESLLNQMVDQEALVKPNTETLTILMLLCNRLRGDRAECVLRTMRELTAVGVKPSLTSYKALLRSSMATKRPGILYAIVEHLERDPSPVERVVEETDGEFFSLAMSAARLLESGPLAERLYALAASHNWKPMGNPSEFLSHFLITVSHYGDLDAAMRYYRECVPRVFIPLQFVYVALLRACRDHRRATRHAMNLWRDIQSFSVRVGAKTQLYDRAISALWSTDRSVARGDVLECAEEILVAMRSGGHAPDAYTLGQVVSLCCAVRSLDEAWDVVEECRRRGESVGYRGIVTLLEKSVEVRRGDAVTKALRFMVENGMTTSTGYLDVIEREVEDVGDEIGTIREQMAGMRRKRESRKTQ